MLQNIPQEVITDILIPFVDSNTLLRLSECNSAWNFIVRQGDLWKDRYQAEWSVFHRKIIDWFAAYWERKKSNQRKKQCQAKQIQRIILNDNAMNCGFNGKFLFWVYPRSIQVWRKDSAAWIQHGLIKPKITNPHFGFHGRKVGTEYLLVGKYLAMYFVSSGESRGVVLMDLESVMEISRWTGEELEWFCFVSGCEMIMQCDSLSFSLERLDGNAVNPCSKHVLASPIRRIATSAETRMELEDYCWFGYGAKTDVVIVEHETHLVIYNFRESSCIQKVMIPELIREPDPHKNIMWEFSRRNLILTAGSESVSKVFVVVSLDCCLEEKMIHFDEGRLRNSNFPLLGCFVDQDVILYLDKNHGNRFCKLYFSKDCQTQTNRTTYFNQNISSLCFYEDLHSLIRFQKVPKGLEIGHYDPVSNEGTKKILPIQSRVVAITWNEFLVHQSGKCSIWSFA